MAAGHLPDSRRLDRDRWQHCGDWPLRVDRARGDMVAELDRLAGGGDISPMFGSLELRCSPVDFSASAAALNGRAMVYHSALPQRTAAGWFIAYARGRNDI